MASTFRCILPFFLSRTYGRGIDGSVDTESRCSGDYHRDDKESESGVHAVGGE